MVDTSASPACNVDRPVRIVCQTGCNRQMIRQWYREKQQQKAREDRVP